MDREKKGSSENEQKNPLVPEEKQPDDKSANEMLTKDQGANDQKGTQEEKSDEEVSADKSKAEHTDADVSQLLETEELKEENLRLKTQLEAIKLGFSVNNMEDAVILAEAIVKRDGTDISTALQAVLKKYPDWEANSSKEGNSGKGGSGFKVGADSSEKDRKADDDRLSSAFGIRKKK